MKRFYNYNAPEGQGRCKADVTLRDGSKAQCGHRAKIEGKCKQHHDIERAKQL